MSKLEETKRIWRKADAVCFDVDSTVLQDEGLDELASFCGMGKEVKEWTNKAMGGNISFRVALRERLNIIRPSKDTLERFVAQHPSLFSKGLKELVSLLHQKGISVYLVSGGFRAIIKSAADELSISSDHIYANQLLFDESGSFSGFDENEPTSDSGGKKIVAQKLKEEKGHTTLVVIGDGATDMEACPPADAFIGYGGNVIRETVKQKAPWFVTDFTELINELKTSNCC
ncbi:hypothetical protein ScPMuIL_007591 [Solemya velum]